MFSECRWLMVFVLCIIGLYSIVILFMYSDAGRICDHSSWITRDQNRGWWKNNTEAYTLALMQVLTTSPCRKLWIQSASVTTSGSLVSHLDPAPNLRVNLLSSRRCLEYKRTRCCESTGRQSDGACEAKVFQVPQLPVGGEQPDASGRSPPPLDE